MKRTDARSSHPHHDLVSYAERLAAALQRNDAELLRVLSQLDGLEAGPPPPLVRRCVRELGWTEDVAKRHLEAAHAVKRFPGLLDLVATGELEVGALAVLDAHLTKESFDELVTAARGKSAIDVAGIVAERSCSLIETEEGTVLAGGVDAETYRQLEELRALISPDAPEGDFSAVLEQVIRDCFEEMHRRAPKA